jgi:hypothetical protein
LYSEEDGSYGGGSVKGDVVVGAATAAAAVTATAAVEPFVRVFPDLLILGKAAVFSTMAFLHVVIVKSAFCRG